MTSPTGELSFQTRSKPFVQDQMDVIYFVEVASCHSKGDGPLGSAGGTGKATDMPGGLQDRTRQEGLGGEVSLLLLYGDSAPLTQSCWGYRHGDTDVCVPPFLASIAQVVRARYREHLEAR